MLKFYIFFFVFEKIFKLDKKKFVYVWYICMLVFYIGKKIGFR